MGKKYRNPPVAEVVCEFQFIFDHPEDLTVLGLIYEKIRNEFPDKQQIGIGFQFLPTEKGLESKIGPGPTMIQFYKKDKSGLIQIIPNANSFSVHQLKPYPTWREFKPTVLKNFNIYKEVANPKGFRKIGLRYINIVEFDKTTIELKDYFQFYPFIPDTLPQPHGQFSDRVEFPYEDNKERLILTLASVLSSKPNILSILFDLDYVMVAPEYIPVDGVSEWLEKAHDRIEKIFEACITDKARKIFDGEKL